MFRISLLVAVLALFLVQPAFCHDVWLQPKGESVTVMFGHGDKCGPYNPDFVKDAKAFDCDGKIVPVEIVRSQDKVALTPKGNPVMITVFWDSGYGMRTTEGWKKISKREATGKYTIIEALKILRYSKAVLKPCDNFAKPLGLALEIVPEKDPFSIKPTEALPVKVLLDGKPLEGAVIKLGDSGHSNPENLPKTDKNGMVEVVITSPGFQVINAEYKSPLRNDPDADVLRTSSSLSFEIR